MESSGVVTFKEFLIESEAGRCTVFKREFIPQKLKLFYPQIMAFGGLVDRQMIFELEPSSDNFPFADYAEVIDDKGRFMGTNHG